MTKTTKKGFWSNFWGFAAAIGVALLIRAFAYEPYNIPSSSMVPSLLVGDYLFISKYPYGYSRHSFPFSLPLIPKGRIFDKMPERGDVVVFRMTPQMQPNLTSSIDYIKRVIGLPGDKIQLSFGRLYINDKLVEREYIGTEDAIVEGHKVTYKKYEETLPNGKKHLIYEIDDHMQQDYTEPFIIPQGYFFALGDNRDNSLDSRFFGPVPLVNLEGRAEIIFYSTTGEGYFWQFWKWPQFVRAERMFTKIK